MQTYQPDHYRVLGVPFQADAAALWVATWSGCLAGREQPNEDDERLKYLLNKHLR